MKRLLSLNISATRDATTPGAKVEAEIRLTDEDGKEKQYTKQFDTVGQLWGAVSAVIYASNATLEELTVEFTV